MEEDQENNEPTTDDELDMEGTDLPMDDDEEEDADLERNAGVEPEEGATTSAAAVAAQQNNNNDNNNNNNSNSNSNKWEPEIGMEFETDEEAYRFCQEYARRMGFSVRKQNLCRSSCGQVKFRRFVCYKEGFSRKIPLKKRARRGGRHDERTGCQAEVGIKHVKSGKFRVHRFEPRHNHELGLPPGYIGRSQSKPRMGSEDNRSSEDKHDSLGAKQKDIFDFLPTTAGGRCELPFTCVDYKYQLNKTREHEMKPADAEAIIRYLQRKATEDRRFYSAIQLDAKDQLTNVFWRDARSKLDFEHFGDVVCFDTTYRANEYGRPFAPIFGVNHHKQIVIFGAAFLYEENAETFRWLFETFKEAMGGNAPQVVLTDQIAEMDDALKEVWPGTAHRHCAWHVYHNATKHLKHIFQSFPTLKTDFSRCLYECEYEDEFMLAWKTMLEKHHLTNNSWLSKLFQDRKKWALVYGREAFYADIKSVQRSERMNVVIKTFLNTERELVSFFRHYERLLEDRRYNESEADFRASQSAPDVPHSRLLKQAASTYTPKVYEMLAKEFELYIDSTIEEYGEVGTISDYKVTNVENCRTGYVRYDSSNHNITCSCKKFEFLGILCWHLLKVLDHKNIKEIPERFILKRWRKDAKSGTVIDLNDSSHENDPRVAIANRYSFLGRVYGQIMAKGSESQEAFEIAVREAEGVLKQLDQALPKRPLDSHHPQASICQRHELNAGEPLMSSNDQSHDLTGRTDTYATSNGNALQPWSLVGCSPMQFSAPFMEFGPGSASRVLNSSDVLPRMRIYKVVSNGMLKSSFLNLKRPPSPGNTQPPPG